MVRFTEKNNPAEMKDIDSTCNELGCLENKWLRIFWSEYNGAVIEDQTVLCSTDQIGERNKTYEIDKNLPDYISIEDDSGGGLILIPKNDSKKFYFLGSGNPFMDDAEIFESIEN
jgi:hypothetical protein